MTWRLFCQFSLQWSQSFLRYSSLQNHRFFTSTARLCITEREYVNKIALKDQYFNQEEKNKETFLDLLEVFKGKNYKTGHIEFIYAALNRMEDYGVDEDLECYKQIIDVMPKGKMIASNVWLASYEYYPKHQHCIVDVLTKMEEKRIMPDRDLFHQLTNIFGKRSSPSLKVLRMLYWMPKMKYASPWPPPEPLPKDQLEAASVAIKQICSVDIESEVAIFQTENDELSAEHTWIVNGQSPTQRTLVQYHPRNIPMYVEGPFKMYLGRKNVVDYVVLRTDMPKSRRRRKFRDPDVIKNLKIPLFDPPTSDDLIPDFSVHEQRDGIIYAVASIGSLSKNSLHSWIRLLQKNGNPQLGNIPIVFRCTFPEKCTMEQLRLSEKKENSEESKESG